MESECFELMTEENEQVEMLKSRAAVPSSCNGVEGEYFSVLFDDEYSNAAFNNNQGGEAEEEYVYTGDEDNDVSSAPPRLATSSSPVKPTAPTTIIIPPPTPVKPNKPVAVVPIIVKVAMPPPVVTNISSRPAKQARFVAADVPPLSFQEDYCPPADDNFDADINPSTLRDRVCRQIHPPDFDQLPEYFNLARTRQALTRSLRQAYDTNQGVNILLVGHSGTGKTHALRAALRSLPPHYYRVIELDGKLVLDDAMAARELSRMLCLTNDARINQSIATLEHDLQDVREQFKPRGTFSDHLALVLGHLQQQEDSTTQTTKLLFLLKNFEHFCHRRTATTANKRTAARASLPQKNSFLYTLLDQAHQSEGKFALVAEYCELDCIQQLDKRLRSRLENVVEYHFPGCFGGANANGKTSSSSPVADMCQLLLSRLQVEGEEDGEDGEQVTRWNGLVRDAVAEYRPFLAVQIQLGQTPGYFLRDVALGAVMQHDFSSSSSSSSASRGGKFNLLLHAKAKLEHPQSTKIRRNMLGREELVLLFTAVYLQRVKKMTEYSFETLYKHSATIRKGGAGAGAGGTKDLFIIDTPKPNLSFVHFESLVQARYLTRRHRPRKDELLTKAPVTLSYNDVDAGLLWLVLQDGHKHSFPLPLLHWAKQLQQY